MGFKKIEREQHPESYKCLHEYFIDQAISVPNNIAVVYKDRSITYKALNQKSDFLAEHLISRFKIEPGDHIGLFLERSIEMIEGILGTLKSGGAYVPQDLKITPENHLRHIIKISNPKIILTLSHLKNKIPSDINIPILELDLFFQSFKNRNNLLPVSPTKNPAQTIFILFTSGTTGNPNGVIVTHNNIANLLKNSPGNLYIKPGQKVGQILNIAFDMAAWEIFGALTAGATLYLRDQKPDSIATNMDVIIATPGILSNINPELCKNIKTVAVAGEPCPQSLSDLWSKKCTFYNGCGPTETTIVNTMKKMNLGEKVNIGKPTPGNTVYILDNNLKPAQKGELWASGIGVTKGYLNNKELTENRYRLDPFKNDGSYMFRTRDIGEWLENGEIQHLGRTDDQIKIRGFRVELDSISAVLESSNLCNQAISVLPPRANKIYTFVKGDQLDLQKLRDFLKKKLPYYSVPEKLIPVSNFPVTNRGKIDRKKLILKINSDYRDI